jgi:hypothetical protein
MSDIWITPHLTDSNVVIQGTDYTGDIPFEHDKTVWTIFIINIYEAE